MDEETDQYASFQMEVCLVMLKSIVSLFKAHQLKITITRWLDKFSFGAQLGPKLASFPPTASCAYKGKVLRGLLRYGLISVSDLDRALGGDLQCVYSIATNVLTQHYAEGGEHEQGGNPPNRTSALDLYGRFFPALLGGFNGKDDAELLKSISESHETLRNCESTARIVTGYLAELVLLMSKQPDEFRSPSMKQSFHFLSRTCGQVPSSAPEAKNPDSKLTALRAAAEHLFQHWLPANLIRLARDEAHRCVSPGVLPVSTSGGAPAPASSAGPGPHHPPESSAATSSSGSPKDQHSAGSSRNANVSSMKSETAHEGTSTALPSEAGGMFSKPENKNGSPPIAHQSTLAGAIVPKDANGISPTSSAHSSTAPITTHNLFASSKGVRGGVSSFLGFAFVPHLHLGAPVYQWSIPKYFVEAPVEEKREREALAVFNAWFALMDAKPDMDMKLIDLGRHPDFAEFIRRNFPFQDARTMDVLFRVACENSVQRTVATRIDQKQDFVGRF